MRHATTLAILSCVFGCAPTSPRTTEPPQVASSASSIKPRDPGPLPPAITQVAQPAEGACEIASTIGLRSIAFRTSREASPFAKLGSPATVRLLVLDKQTFYVKASTSSFELWGYATADTVPLFPAKPIVLGGFYVPHHESPLKLVDVAPGKLTVAHEWPSFVKNPTTESATAVVTCADVTTSFGVEFSPETFGKPKSMTKLIGPSVPISASPKEKPVAELLVTSTDFGLAGLGFGVLETSGAFSRVVTLYGLGTLVGWVPTKSLKAAPDAPWAGGGGSYAGESRKPKAWKDGESPTYTCAAAVPIVVRSGDGVVQVGTIAANTPIETNSNDATTLKVRLTKEKTITSDDALLVRQADVDTCDRK